METENNAEAKPIDWQAEYEKSNDLRYDRLADRVSRLEKRGRFLESASEEKLYLLLFAVYVAAEVLIPLLSRLTSGAGSAGQGGK